MSSFRGSTVAAALVVAIGCGGGVDKAPDGAREGGGGANGVGDNKQPTAAERTGSTPGNSGGANATLSAEDQQFVEKASMSGEMEVALGNLAEDKATNDEVKQLAEKIAEDHEAANRDLQSSVGGARGTGAAGGMGMGAGTGTAGGTGTGTGTGAGSAGTGSGTAGGGTAAGTGTDAGRGAMGGDASRAGGAQMMPEHNQTRQRLEKMSGAAFDRAYLEEMVKHHEKDIQEFERASNSTNPQVRAFAEKTLPTLRQHLQMSQQLQQKIRTR